MNLLMRRRLMMQQKQGGRLPSEYQEVEAVISSGGAYFDLPKISFNTGDTIKVDVKFQYLGTKSDNFWLAGDGRNRSGIQYELGHYGGRWWGVQYEAVYTFTGIYPNEIVEGTWEHVYTSGSDITYRMFQRYGSGAESDGRKFFYFTLSFNGTVRHNLVPCYRKADNVVGMYDTVTNTFFINKGSGTFSIPT